MLEPVPATGGRRQPVAPLLSSFRVPNTNLPPTGPFLDGRGARATKSHRHELKF